jgi:hypothetical protein
VIADIIDIVAEDARGMPVLVAEAKASRLTPHMVEEYRDYLRAKSSSAPYGLLADLEKIYLFDFSSKDAVETLAILATPEILEVYDPEFGTKRIFESYLEALIDAWLRDLAFHWKSSLPPGSDVLWRTGLMARLRGGDTRREVPVAVDSVC